MRINGINMETAEVDVSVKQHHIRAELCQTRARYREGRHSKAVKVYTVNQESKYLLVQGIPSVGAHDDLIRMFASYGHLAEHKFLDEYPSEKFTEVLLFKYKLIQAARLAKRKLDDFNFFGGVLHVCYAPEYETVQETREKLEDRRKAISARIRKLAEETQTKKGHVPQNSEETSKPVSRHSNAKTLMSHKYTMPDGGWSETSDINIEQQTMDNSNTATGHETKQSYNSGNTNHSQPNIHDAEIPNLTDNPFPDSAAYHTATQNNIRTVRNMYPSQDQEHYKGSRTIPQPILQSQQGKNDDPKKEKLIVRPFKSKTAASPKFVPRQVNRIRTGIRKTGEARSNLSATPDPINERLRSEALTLGKLAGPDLPAEEKKQRESFKRAATTGDEALEKTAMEIRSKVQKFCEIAVPIQVKKKRRK